MESHMHPNYTTAALVLGIFALFFWAQDNDHGHEWAHAKELEIAKHEEQRKQAREFAGQQLCGPGAIASWLDDSTLTCTPKRGKAYQVAEAR